MGEIFPPSKVHMDQGTTRLRRLCVTGGAASQISFCLWKTFIAIQNITWISAGILHKKIYLKRYTVIRYGKWFSYLGAFTLTEMLTHGAVYKKQVYEVFLECYC